ncbi:MAG: helix-turn-helix transcriptional regulator [Phycisphaerales bacterium]|nr:helix-turn-helix transcriptional regulator [Phycisphaerales bacterium]
MTDKAILIKIGERLAKHRLRRNLMQEELAREAGVSKRTVVRIEGGESTQLTNMIRVIRALDLLKNLDAFLPPLAPSPLEQLRGQGKQRKRASPKPEKPPLPKTSKKWTWDENGGNP